MISAMFTHLFQEHRRLNQQAWSQVSQIMTIYQIDEYLLSLSGWAPRPGTGETMANQAGSTPICTYSLMEATDNRQRNELETVTSCEAASHRTEHRWCRVGTGPYLHSEAEWDVTQNNQQVQSGHYVKTTTLEYFLCRALSFSSLCEFFLLAITTAL